MNSSEIRKYQETQLKMLKDIYEICEKLDIEYYMIGGTVLGAVRHGGFIPWDADIDIAMKRKDYEALRQYFAANENEKYFYEHYSTEKNHLSPHALIRIKGTNINYCGRVSEEYQPKYTGIYLDIFPLDEPPKEKHLQEKQMKKIKNIKRIIELKAGYTYKDTSVIKKHVKRIVQIPLSVISMERLNRCLDRAMTKYSGSGSGMLVSMASHYSYWKQLMPEDVYGKPKKLEFEGLKFSAPAKPHEYLTKIYGDYMQLPPEEKRFSDLDNIISVDYEVEEE